MARSSKTEVARRVAAIVPLVIDCFALREIRQYVTQKTDWGALVSERTLKRYIAAAREQIREAALIDTALEYGAAKRRLERVIARAAAKGELRTLLSANKQLTELLGLAAPLRIEHSDSTWLSAPPAEQRPAYDLRKLDDVEELKELRRLLLKARADPAADERQGTGSFVCRSAERHI